MLPSSVAICGFSALQMPVRTSLPPVDRQTLDQAAVVAMQRKAVGATRHERSCVKDDTPFAEGPDCVRSIVGDCIETLCREIDLHAIRSSVNASA